MTTADPQPSSSAPESGRMCPGFSAYINLLRFGAAMMVFVAHLSEERYSGGLLPGAYWKTLGSDAVILFFVLSGFVIAYTAAHKDRNFGAFLFSRSTRIYSVMIPALLLGWGLDQIGEAAVPAAYDHGWYGSQPLWFRLQMGLLFVAEWAPYGTGIGSNPPLWSLSYEVAYYLLFGFAVYLTGAKRVALLALGLVLVGLDVLLLAPAWLIGVWLYRRLPDAVHLPSGVALCLLVGAPVIYVVGLTSGVPELLESSGATLLGAERFAGVRYANEFLWNNLIAVLVAGHLYGAAAVLRSRRLPATAQIAWLAGASFSIYVVHYPVLHLLSSVMPDSGMLLRDTAIVAGLTMLFAFAFAALFERPLRFWRTQARAVAARLAVAGPRRDALQR